MADKNVRKVSGTILLEETSDNEVTDEQLGNELGYLIGRQLIEKMLEKGLITQGEFNQIEQKNRDTFRPYLVDLLPRIT